MDELRKEAVQALASLSEEQLRLVLAYALCLLDSGPAPRVHTLEDLLEESA